LESVISHPSFKLHKIIARYATHISDELGPIKGVCYGQICTSTCIVYHKLCEIHHVFQIEYITKLITHFPVQFNYVKINSS